MASFTRVLTRSVSPERAEKLHPVRHHNHFCSTESKPTDPSVEQRRCGRQKKKKKKKKRKCLDGESGGECVPKKLPIKKKPPENRSKANKKCESEDSEECQRVDVNDNKKRQQKIRFGEKQAPKMGPAKKQKKPTKVPKHKKFNRASNHQDFEKTTETTTTPETTTQIATQVAQITTNPPLTNQISHTRASNASGRLAPGRIASAMVTSGMATSSILTTTSSVTTEDPSFEEDYHLDVTTEWEDSTTPSEDGTFRPD